MPRQIHYSKFVYVLCIIIYYICSSFALLNFKDEQVKPKLAMTASQFQTQKYTTGKILAPCYLNFYVFRISSQTSKCDNGEERLLAEESALLQLRLLVKDILLEDYMHDDGYLIKFLRAKKLNVNDTVEMIKSAMKWRKENRMNEITKEDFTRFQKDYTIFFQGYDNEGRPIYTTITRLIDPKKMIETGELELFKRYLVRNLEETAERIRAIGKKNITQHIGIFDFDGIDRNKHTCFQCLNIIAYFIKAYDNYYPQQSYITYGINMSTAAIQVMDTLRPIMSDNLKETIRIFGTNKEEWSKELLKQIPKDQLFIRYGGTKVVSRDASRVQFAL